LTLLADSSKMLFKYRRSGEKAPFRFASGFLPTENICSNTQKAVIWWPVNGSNRRPYFFAKERQMRKTYLISTSIGSLGETIRNIVTPEKVLRNYWKANGLAISLRLGGKRMTVDSIISRLTQYSSWLFSRNWERWEILTIAIVALALILLVGRTRRKARINKKHIQHYTPIIGSRLAHHGARH